MRTIEEIEEDVRSATGSGDAEMVRTLAAEMRAIGGYRAEAAASRALAGVSVQIGEYESALEHYTSALDACQASRDLSGAALATLGIGNVLVRIGDFSLAAEHYRRALAFYEERDERLQMARAYSGIGIVYAKVGDYPLSIEYYHRALSIFLDENNQVGAAKVLGNMGVSYSESGDDRLALDYYARALEIEEGRNDANGIACIVGNTGNVYANLGDYDKALEWFHRAIDLHAATGDRASVSLVTGSMVDSLISMGRYDEAVVLLDRQAAMPLDRPSVRSGFFADRAAIAVHAGDLDAAHRHLTQALDIASSHGMRVLEVSYHEKLRDLAQKRNDFAGYIEHNNEYQRISEEIRGKEATQRLTMMEAERKMEAEMRARDKERALLYGALPKSVADRMIRGEDVSGDHFDNAAVMFLDIVGFTSHTSHMPPAEVVKMLENIFRTIDGISASHNVVKVKTIGDSYMCFRGDADASANALSIAHVALDVLKVAFTWPDGSPVQCRIGAHIGPVTAGVIGTERLQYDVWGDTVNVASRMESNSEPGRIHVSSGFALALNGERAKGQEKGEMAKGRNGEMALTLRGEVEIKGKGTMTTYWLEGAS